jgi:hypothetical protein
MGIFSKILDKLGFGEKSKEAVVVVAPTAEVIAAQTEATGAVVMSDIDVVAKLEALAAAHAEKLNWRVSIVDLMKLLGLDSHLGVRCDLATELGCPSEKMSDSAAMNVWLHKTVLQKLAENGGNIPASLLT